MNHQIAQDTWNCTASSENRIKSDASKIRTAMVSLAAPPWANRWVVTITSWAWQSPARWSPHLFPGASAIKVESWSVDLPLARNVMIWPRHLLQQLRMNKGHYSQYNRYRHGDEQLRISLTIGRLRVGGSFDMIWSDFGTETGYCDGWLIRSSAADQIWYIVPVWELQAASCRSK